MKLVICLLVVLPLGNLFAREIRAVSPDGRYEAIAAFNEGVVKLVKADGTEVWKRRVAQYRISQLKFSGNSQRLVMAPWAHNLGTNEIQVYDFPTDSFLTGYNVPTIEGHITTRYDINDLEVLEDGSAFVLSVRLNGVYVFDVENKNIIQSYKPSHEMITNPVDIKLCEDKDQLFVANSAGSVHVYGFKSGVEILKAQVGFEYENMGYMKVRDDCKYFAFSGFWSTSRLFGSTVYLYQMEPWPDQVPLLKSSVEGLTKFFNFLDGPERLETETTDGSKNAWLFSGKVYSGN